MSSKSILAACTFVFGLGVSLAASVAIAGGGGGYDRCVAGCEAVYQNMLLTNPNCSNFDGQGHSCLWWRNTCITGCGPAP